MTQPIAGCASTYLKAACASVRSPPRVRKSSWSTFCRPSISHERGRWRRWSLPSKVCSGVRWPSSSPDEVGTRAITPTPLPVGELEELGARRLLEQVVDRLQRGQAGALGERAHALVAPADLGAERDPVVAQLALGLQRLELLEQRVGVDPVHARVVELVEVDVVRAQAPQRGLERAPGVLRRPVVGALRLLVALALGVEHVAELGRELVGVAGAARALERLADELLVDALAVGVAGVEEGDAEVERAGDEGVGRLVLAPPVRAERPGAEADRGGLEIRVAEGAPPHRARV